ncbi:MAG: hypothetical protein ABI925_05960 [Verrucomicrobiota bacterium]
MMPDIDGKSESVKSDPGDLARVLELELLQKRADWQRKSERYRTIRAVSLFCLLIIVLAGIASLFFLFSHLQSVPHVPTR